MTGQRPYVDLRRNCAVVPRGATMQFWCATGRADNHLREPLGKEPVVKPKTRKMLFEYAVVRYPGDDEPATAALEVKPTPIFSDNVHEITDQIRVQFARQHPDADMTSVEVLVRPFL